MLSRQSFNALLKTLEEPPRARQVPVRNNRSAETSGHRAVTLPAVQSEAPDDEPDCRAYGRDLCRRATRYGGCGAQTARPGSGGQYARWFEPAGPGAGIRCRAADGYADVAEMLGSMDRHRIIALLDLLAAGHGPDLIAAIHDLDELVPDYEIVLDEIATALQRIAVIQVAGADAVEDEDELESLAFAWRVTSRRNGCNCITRLP